MSVAKNVDPLSVFLAPEIGPHNDALVGLVAF
jgi:hypothetical protein